MIIYFLMRNLCISMQGAKMIKTQADTDNRQTKDGTPNQTSRYWKLKSFPDLYLFCTAKTVHHARLKVGQDRNSERQETNRGCNFWSCQFDRRRSGRAATPISSAYSLAGLRHRTLFQGACHVTLDDALLLCAGHGRGRGSHHRATEKH